MRKIFLLLIISLVCGVANAAPLTITMSGYPISTTGWTVGGSATTIDSTIRLTTSVPSQRAYVNYNTAINMGGYCQFTAEFDFRIQVSSSGRADGMAFYFLTAPPSATSGTGGGGIGLPNNPNGFILIMDTYDNNSDVNNPIIAIRGYDGTTTSYVEGSTTGALAPDLAYQSFVSNGLWHHCKVTYYLGNINVYYDYSATPTISGFYNLTVTGQFGFCSSTGAVSSTHSIKNVSIIADGCLDAINNGPVCKGDTLRLYAIGDSTGATYAWSNTSSGFTSTSQNPVINSAGYVDSGTYRVIKTVSGVPDTAYTHVVIKHKPDISIATNAPVCSGDSITIAAGPDSVGQTYSWINTTNGFTSTAQSFVIYNSDYDDTGTYTVYANLNGCKDTTSVRIQIYKLHKPDASISDTSICSGSSFQLFGFDSTAGASLSWSGPAGFATTVLNPIISSATTAQTGNYILQASLPISAFLTCYQYDTVHIRIRSTPPIPDMMIPTPKCSGASYTFVVTLDTAGATFNWVGPNGFTSTMENPTISPLVTAATGIYTLYMTYDGCTTYRTVYMRVDSTPAVPLSWNNSSICSGDTLELYSLDTTAGVTYSWAGPGSFTSTSQNPVIYNTPSFMTGNYTVTATLGLCSNNSVTFANIYQTPSAPVVGTNAPVCSGTLLTFSAMATPTGGIYYWSGPNGFSSTIQNPSILNAPMEATGFYQVYEILNGCISPTSFIYASINQTPGTPILSSNSPVCEGNTLNLFADDTTASVTYLWNGPNTFSTTEQNPVITNVTPAAEGLYTVYAILGPCRAFNTMYVDITNTPTLNISSNSPVCSGDTLKLTAISEIGNTFMWEGPYNFADSSGGLVNRIPAEVEYSGTYTVTATEPGGCFKTGTIDVQIIQSPGEPWVTWMTYCQYDVASVLTPVDSRIVHWYTSSAGGTFSTTAPVPATDVPGVYFFYLDQTVNGCTSPIDSIQIVVNPKPTVTLAASQTAICTNTTVTLSATDPNPFSTYHWMPWYYLSNTTAATITANPVTSIVYSVVSTNQYGCTDTATADITVYPSAVLSINAGDSVVMYPGQSYHIQPQTNCTSVTWFPSEWLSAYNSIDPITTPEGNIMYIATGTTEYGCSVSDSIYIHLNDEVEYHIPNAFAPGNGPNNIFKLNAFGIASLKHFRIYDRWGVMVFETTNINEGWDGMYNGTAQPMGVYVYDIEAISSYTNKKMKKTGNITLLR